MVRDKIKFDEKNNWKAESNGYALIELAPGFYYIINRSNGSYAGSGYADENTTLLIPVKKGDVLHLNDGTFIQGEVNYEPVELDTGVKYDEDKPEYGTFLMDFKEPLEELYKVWAFGKKKYGLGNWKKLKNGYDRYKNALIRHFFKGPSNLDEETGCFHATHMAFNSLAMIQFMEDVQCLEPLECSTADENKDKGVDTPKVHRKPHKECSSNRCNEKCKCGPPDNSILDYLISQCQPTAVTNIKTGKQYMAYLQDSVINCTNSNDGEYMIYYYDPADPELAFVREKREFYQKFVVDEDEKVTA